MSFQAELTKQRPNSAVRSDGTEDVNPALTRLTASCHMLRWRGSNPVQQMP
ncbi:MAG: hypothetical protein AAFQ89_14025 [Cyanobacteria bacterium J06626_18]